ncbi:hypothetical protein L3Q82_015510 [Scortum barcoo]|uniref:Uncharacterized protein n=1 Tax=Scortum barcoo TaxID=214431 RepID=A0ACB8VP76_9TELE|nr:hypothetical protein L3Q82_015510 [Scortum barcoo]
MSAVKLEEYRERIRSELDAVVDFWLKYSHDSVHGGFFTCIGRDGTVYDELKYVWLQGRQVWMYCRLYRTMERFHRPEILQAAKAGGAFLRKFARVSSGGSSQWKCAFCLTRDGKTVKIQRTIFSECFYILAMDELSRVTGDKDMQLEAEQMMQQLIFWVREDPSGLGRPQLPGDAPTNSMAVPMMLLCLVQQLTEGRGQEVVQKYRELGSWCVQQILQHIPDCPLGTWCLIITFFLLCNWIQRDGTAILESVSPEGAELPGCQGRLQNPGHALEAGWFLLQFSAERGDEELQRTAVDKFVELPYQSGWDKEHGGLFYFLDVDGHCPTQQLEWSMKLWWPHCEALIAFLMAYSQTKKPELLDRFSQVYEYIFSHFPDAKNGEWFGYLTQEGKVALDFKGGPFKGKNIFEGSSMFLAACTCVSVFWMICSQTRIEHSHMNIRCPKNVNTSSFESLRFLTDMCVVVPPSGTGVFYQAMPAVGADGKNIMKLIPVQMVNRNFVQTQMRKPVGVNISSAPVQAVEKAALNPSAAQQVVKKQVSLVNTLPNQVGLDLGSPLNKWIQEKTANLMAKLSPTATNRGRSLKQLPVTVKSPALPRGQYRQITPNAQVRTVPASELSAGVRKQIFTSSASSSSDSGVPNVVLTVSQGVTPPCDSALQTLKLLSQISTSCGPPPKGSKRPHLKLIPKVSRRPNSPIKWVIEDEDISTAPLCAPLLSPAFTSEILHTVAEREKNIKPHDISTKTVSHSFQAKRGQGEDNALVMCNGKVFFVPKKSSSLFNTGKSDSPTAATKRYEFNKTSSQISAEPLPAEGRHDLQIIIPDEADEVIDLCDDDAQDDSSQQAASANQSAGAQVDEDNVIFVSYIPPRSESGSTQNLKLKKHTEQRQSPAGGDDRQETSAPCPRKPGLSSNIDSEQSSSNKQLETMEGDGEADSPADPSDSNSGTSSQVEKHTNKMESSLNPAERLTSPAQESRQVSDHLLRQRFGITADVKVCLQRISEASAGCFPAESQQRTAEAHQEPTRRLEEKDPLLQHLYSPQETDSYRDSAISVKREKEQEPSADPATPLKCSHFKLNTKPLSAVKNKCPAGQSSLRGASCGFETQPVIGYVEPIDEDFLSTDENDIPNSQDTQTCVDLNTNTRRIGRTRKRTVCLCCVAGTQSPAAKFTAKSSEPERKWERTNEQTSRRGGRTKASRKDVKTSCLTAKNKQTCKTHTVPASDSLTSVDYNDLKQQEQIRRLKELLREKEAALEKMRKSLSRD